MTNHPPTDSRPNRTRPGPATAPPERLARGPIAVGSVTGKVTRPILGKRGLAEGNLISHWEAIVGSAVAAHALPERIKFPRGRRENGELIVRVASGPFAMQLQHDAPVVIERINSYFGYPAVRTVKIFQAPLPLRRTRTRKPPPAPLSGREESELAHALEGVTDPGLRAALDRLGRSMRQKRRSRP